MRYLPLARRSRLLSALLALWVLATSVGFSVEQHRCRLSGRRTVRMHLPHLASQAAARANDCAKCRAGSCCDVSHQQHKLNAPSAGPVAKWLPASPWLLPALPPAPGWLSQACGTGRWAAAERRQVAPAPPPGPPRAGRILLVRYRTWRV